MARVESDREDLFEELRSAHLRWEFRISGDDETLVAGVRRDGRLSIYFTPDECYHFHLSGGLLRAFVGPNLYRTQGATLARLRRHRTEGVSELLRYDLTAEELAAVLDRAQSQLTRLLEQIRSGTTVLLRSHAPEENPWEPLIVRLTAILSAPLHLAPAYPTRND